MSHLRAIGLLSRLGADMPPVPEIHRECLASCFKLGVPKYVRDILCSHCLSVLAEVL